jgi:hypothetical protein
MYSTTNQLYGTTGTGYNQLGTTQYGVGQTGYGQTGTGGYGYNQYALTGTPMDYCIQVFSFSRIHVKPTTF